MKVKINEKDKLKLETLFQINEKNIFISSFYDDILQNSKNISSIFNNNMLSTIRNYYELDKDFFESLRDFDLKSNFCILKKEKYQNNEYVKHISLTSIKNGLYEFNNLSFNPYEPFIYDEIKVDKKFYEHTKIGVFEEKFDYLALYEKSDIWMLITPHEINTMQKAIDQSFGKVITYGLGLGYFAYMCSLKDNVESITIIEKDKTIIDLFQKYILPQFEYKDKISIICDDALDFIKTKSYDFDFSFIDLYKDVNDGLPLYIKMYQQSLMHKNSIFMFWIEASMIIMLRRCLITCLYESYYTIEVKDEPENFFDVIINKFKQLLNNQTIHNYDDIENLLSDKSIKELITKI